MRFYGFIVNKKQISVLVWQRLAVLFVTIKNQNQLD